MMKTSMLRGGSGGSGAYRATATNGRVSGSGESGRPGGSSLAQLESVLQQLNKHEHHTHIASVERTSAQTQQQLLKDRLFQVQEELALAQSDKVKLCDKLGALQQINDTQKSEIEHLRVELRSSRESQTVMVKKVTRLEMETLDLKQSYIRSVTCRVKTAGELLAKLTISGALKNDATDLSKTVQTRCEEWVGPQQNKRKRVEDAPTHAAPATIEIDAVDLDETMDAAELAPITSKGGHKENKECEQSDPQDDDAVMANAESPKETGHNEQEQQPHSSHECQTCLTLTSEIKSLKATNDEKLTRFNVTLAELQAQHEQQSQAHRRSEAEVSNLSQLLSEKDGLIEQLKGELEAEQLKVKEAKLAAVSKEDEEMKEKGDDGSDRVKVLEDNLAQLNTYADHLEMLINQCASCSVKLQSEGTTQDSAK